MDTTTNGAAASASSAPGAPPLPPRTILLRKQITAHEGTISRLTLREPVAADFIDLGKIPFATRGTNEETIEVNIDMKLAGQWIARLSGLDDLLVRQLGAKDFMAAVNLLSTVISAEGDSPGN